MQRLFLGVAFSVVALLVSSCGTEPTVNRVGVNVVDKSLFQGSWYMSRTVIDVDYEASGLGTFPGDAASDSATTFTAMPRIRWVIDKNQLTAFRDYEMLEGGEGEPREPGTLIGEPVAAFKIEKHFDIRRAYNTTTGEEQNVIEENDVDGEWWERPYMRVDWSRNLLPGYYGQTADLYSTMGFYTREDTDLFVQDRSQFPSSWQPRFDFMQCASDADDACAEHERDFADQYDRDELYHMSFVTQELLSPGEVPDPSSGQSIAWCASDYSDAPHCSTITSYVRTSFLKVSDRRQYQAQQWNDSRFDRFGYFRLERPTYDRSTGRPDDPAQGATDFLNYSVNRHNIWKQWRDAAGRPLPYTERDVRQVVWYTTPELPAHLVQPTFDVINQWNEVLMATVRQLRGQPAAHYPDMPCQSDDPDGYCFCQPDPETGAIITPMCPGRYDAFVAPSTIIGATDPFDCHIEVPANAEPDLDTPGLSDEHFMGWFDARMVGSECVTVLRINNCNRATIADNDGSVEGLECQERGDLRFKFMSYVDQPGTAFLGIATLRGDPVSGEIITGDANIGGPALDSFRASALRTYDLIHGTLDPRDLVTGEDVRGYFENIGHIDLPALPRTDFSRAIGQGSQAVQSARTQAEITAHMQRAMGRLTKLQGADGRQNIYSDRLQQLAGTPLERRLLDNAETMVMAGLQSLPDGAAATRVTETMLDQVSPFRHSADDVLFDATQEQHKLARANVMMPNEFVDDSIQHFVNKHSDWSRARLEIGLNRLLFRQTQLHELGHCWGLRHNFGGSADRDHYHPDFYAIDARFPLPNPDEYDTDGHNGLSADEAAAYEADYAQMRERRELSGIDGEMNASVMEYTSNWYQRLQPIGLYDRAAIAFGYGDLVEAYEGEVSPAAPRIALKHYLGGEPCNVDADCPYAEGGTHSRELLASNLDHGLTQRCVANPSTRTSNLCSSLDDQLEALGSLNGELSALRYRFCSDERAAGGSEALGTLAWCNRFDEGDSYREIVRNIAESYERMYLFSNFRRYQSGFSFGGYRGSLVGRRFVILQSIYQNLVYRYASDPGFRSELGAFGFYDEFLATADILNFYARILGQPAIGSYVLDGAGVYQRVSNNPDLAGADLSVPLGLGRYFNSDYQRGLTGIERMERIGSFVDSLWAMQMMTARGQQSRYTRNVAFYANFYDLFPNEMQQIFNGMIRNAPETYMPRLACGGVSPTCTDPRLVYMDFYRGDCSSEETCRPSPQETYGELPVLSGGGSFILQIYAAIYGLTAFPVYFDTSFANQMFICVEGAGDCPTPGPGAVEGVDYVRYTSPQYLKSFLAWQLESSVGVDEQESIGFAMVKQAREMAFIIEMLNKLRNGSPPYALSNLSDDELARLRAIPYEPPLSPSAVANDREDYEISLANLESFLNEIINIQRDLSIVGPGVFAGAR